MTQQSPQTESIDPVARAGVELAREEIGSLRKEIKEGFTSVFTRLDDDNRAKVKDSKSGIGMISTFALGVVGLTFSFTTLVTQPLREEASRHTMQIEKIHDDAARHLERDGELRNEMGKISILTTTNAGDINRVEDDLKKSSDKASTNAERISRIEGKLESK